MNEAVDENESGRERADDSRSGRPAFPSRTDRHLPPPVVDVERTDAVAAHAPLDPARADAVIRRVRRDPVFFCREVLGVQPWSKQAAILETLRDHDRVAVRSGHGTGKSFISAAAALWFLYAHHPAKVVTTAPTWAQVRLILWSEIRRLHAAARVPLGGRVLEERIKVGDDAFAVGLATDEAERFQGFHAEHLLVILDEAPGVRDVVWEAAETLLTGRVGKLLAIGNPTRPEGRFFACFRPGAPWATVHIRCLDSPNVAAEDHASAGVTAGTTDLPYPRLVTRRWIDARAKEWGVDSPMFRARVLGEFPVDDANVLIPRAWFDASSSVDPDGADGASSASGRARRPTLDDPGEPSGAWRLGVDVARHGDDATVFCLRDDRGVRALESQRGWTTMQTAGRVAALLRTLPLDPAHVFVDDTGLGAGVTDRLHEQDFPVAAVIASSSSTDRKRFVNRRAENFWRLREAMRPRPGDAAPDASGVADAPPFILPPEADELRRELAALTFSLDSGGAIRVVDKHALRAVLGRSPDQADALALTFADADKPRLEPVAFFL